jgi:hypothetical protein
MNTNVWIDSRGRFLTHYPQTGNALLMPGDLVTETCFTSYLNDLGSFGMALQVPEQSFVVHEPWSVFRNL